MIPNARRRIIMSWTFAFVSAQMLTASAPAEDAVPTSTYAPIGDEVGIPYGWVWFCGGVKALDYCDGGKRTALDVRLTAKSWDGLNEINKAVNHSLKEDDKFDHDEHWLDNWRYPKGGVGGNSSYCLMKRKLLIQKGFPASALLLTVVKRNGGGHLVLTVKTDHGEFVLDDLTDEIFAWEKSNYKFVKRQSQINPNIWLSM